MKSIYDAIRALLYPGDAHHNAGRSDQAPHLSASLRLVLQRFEVENRGHRSLLDDPLLGAQAAEDLSTEARARQDTLRRTVSVLLNALLQDALGYGRAPRLLPETTELDALLDAEDSLGWIDHWMRAQLEWFASDAWRAAAPVRYLLVTRAVNVHAGRHVLELVAKDRRTAAVATRRIELPGQPVRTIREARAALEQGRAHLALALRDVEAWPEFAQALTTH